MKKKHIFWSTFVILLYFVINTVLEYENLDLKNRYLLILIFTIILIVQGIRYIKFKNTQ
jgi:uncharacterized membrane protein